MASGENDAANENAKSRGFLTRQWGRVRQLFSDMEARSALRAQMADLDRRGGLDNVLTDLGISRPALESIIRGYPESGRLLPAMAKRLGLDITKLDPRWRYNIQRNCAECQSQGRCRHWLATASAESTEYRAFCPNAELFDPVLESAPEI